VGSPVAEVALTKFAAPDGSEVEVTQSDVDSLVTAKTEYTTAQKVLENAIDELKQL
jgi:hypothetical protein